MPDDLTIALASLRFTGNRFAGHALDVECTQELLAYRTLVLECAKELWRRKNPGRVRLPKGFEDGFRLQFDHLGEGSTTVPLRRLRDPAQSGPALDDEFDEAAALVDAAITAAGQDALLPQQMPASVIPLFASFGRTLREDEVLFTRARGSLGEAAYTQKARATLADWVSPTYVDKVQLEGEVRMASLGTGVFRLHIAEGGSQVEGRFAPEQEALVLEALRGHRSTRLRVVGIAEFSLRERQIKRLVRIDELSLASPVDDAFDASAPPIWERLSQIGQEAPPSTWDAVPTDLSQRIDDIVYKHKDGGR